MCSNKNRVAKATKSSSTTANEMLPLLLLLVFDSLFAFLFWRGWEGNCETRSLSNFRLVTVWFWQFQLNKLQISQLAHSLTFPTDLILMAGALVWRLFFSDNDGDSGGSDGLKIVISTIVVAFWFYCCTILLTSKQKRAGVSKTERKHERDIKCVNKSKNEKN